MNGLLTLNTFEAAFPSIDTSTPELKDEHSTRETIFLDIRAIQLTCCTVQGTAVALYEVGAALGALSCYFVGDRFGRKWTTFAGAVVVLIGVILQSSAYSLAQLIVARIVTGTLSNAPAIGRHTRQN